MLMYPLGAQSVKCSVCHFVTHVSQQANWGPSSSGGQQAAPKTQTVVVENPPSLDEQGNEVRGLVLVPAGSSCVSADGWQFNVALHSASVCSSLCGEGDPTPVTCLNGLGKPAAGMWA